MHCLQSTGPLKHHRQENENSKDHHHALNDVGPDYRSEAAVGRVEHYNTSE